MTALQALAQGAATLAAQPLPPDVAHHAKRAVVDWAAALVPGAIESPAIALERALSGALDRGSARLALGRSAEPRTAALINGTAAHSVEVDDIYREAIYHPGAPTIAAALAAAQHRDVSGEELLRAVVVGYEVSTRVGETLGRAHYRYWHSTGTVGTFGAAAAAAALLRLDAHRFAHTLATAGTFAAGLQQAFRRDSMSKPLHAGRAAEGGLLAALLADAGVTGSLDVLDGEAGMGVAMASSPDWGEVAATLGKDFHIARITFKNHACCGHTFAAIDAALELQRRMKVPAEDLIEITVQTYAPALEVAGHPNPRTPAEARFSIPYVLASALVHGSVRLAAFQPHRLSDMPTRTLMAKVRLEVDAGIDAAFPGRRAARVRFRTADGRQAELLQPTRKGDPELPLTDADLQAKFCELAGPVLGDAKTRTVHQRLWRLDELAEVRTLLDD